MLDTIIFGKHLIYVDFDAPLAGYLTPPPLGCQGSRDGGGGQGGTTLRIDSYII